MNGRGNSLISLVSGAALGAVTMYLLDPEAGPKRREQLGERAEAALSGAGGALSSGISQLNEKASALSAMVGEQVGNLRDSHAAGDAKEAIAGAGERLSQLGRDLISRAKGWTSDAGDWGRGVADDAGQAGASLSRRARSAASDAHDTFQGWTGGGRDESHTARNTTIAVSAVVTAAAAAGAMYFLDPARGRQRRADAGEKLHQIVSDTSNAFRGLGNYCQTLVNRTRETATDVQDAIGMGTRDESTYGEPVRSADPHQQDHAPMM